MIVEFLLNLVLGILNMIFSLISLPATPAVVSGAISQVLPYIAFPVAVARVYIGERFFDAVFNLVIAAFVVMLTIRPALWLYNKIRGSGN